MANQPLRNVFAEVVSLDAWLAPNSKAPEQYALHADLVFSHGRMGTESESKVRFKLSIKRAELVLKIGHVEPIEIIKHTVSRDGREVKGKKVTTNTTKSKAGVSGNMELGLGSEGFSGGAKVATKGELAYEGKAQITSCEELSDFRVTQLQTPEGDYRWEILPTKEVATLDGRPWDAAKDPRLSLRDLRHSLSKNIPFVVRLEIHCLREDLEISGIELKAPTKRVLFGSVKEQGVKLAAAEAYIRNALSAIGGSVDDIAEPYERLTIAIESVESND